MMGPERRGSERATPQRLQHAADTGRRRQPSRARHPNTVARPPSAEASTTPFAPLARPASAASRCDKRSPLMPRSEPVVPRAPAPLPAAGVVDGVVWKPMQEWTSGIVVVAGRKPSTGRRRRLVGVAALLAIAAGILFERSGFGPGGPALYGQAMAAVRRAEAVAASLIEPNFPSAVPDKAAPPEL
jgi:hypothetical protein